MIINPYTELEYDKSDVALFPALKFFLPLDESSGSRRVTEAVNGQAFDIHGDFGSPVDWDTTENALTIAPSGGYADLDTTIPVGANRMVAIMCGVMGTITTADFKNAAGAATLISFAQSSHTLADGAGNSANVSQNFQTSNKAVALQFIPGTSGEANGYMSTEATSAAVASVDGAPADMTTMDTIAQFGFAPIVGNVTIFSMSLFVFTSYEPSTAEIDAACAWMLNKHINGSKLIYPGWVGKT